jgi:hypothetical protein
MRNHCHAINDNTASMIAASCLESSSPSRGLGGDCAIEDQVLWNWFVVLHDPMGSWNQYNRRRHFGY